MDLTTPSMQLNPNLYTIQLIIELEDNCFSIVRNLIPSIYFNKLKKRILFILNLMIFISHNWMYFFVDPLPNDPVGLVIDISRVQNSDNIVI